MIKVKNTYVNVYNLLFQLYNCGNLMNVVVYSVHLNLKGGVLGLLYRLCIYKWHVLSVKLYKNIYN